MIKIIYNLDRIYFSTLFYLLFIKNQLLYKNLFNTPFLFLTEGELN